MVVCTALYVDPYRGDCLYVDCLCGECMRYLIFYVFTSFDDISYDLDFLQVQIVKTYINYLCLSAHDEANTTRSC